MNKFNKWFAVFAMVLVAGAASAEVDAGITTIITGATTTITGIISAVLGAGGTILLAALGLKALPYAYRKIVGFFQ